MQTFDILSATSVHSAYHYLLLASVGYDQRTVCVAALLRNYADKRWFISGWDAPGPSP